VRAIHRDDAQAHHSARGAAVDADSEASQDRRTVPAPRHRQRQDRRARADGDRLSMNDRPACLFLTSAPGPQPGRRGRDRAAPRRRSLPLACDSRLATAAGRRRARRNRRGRPPSRRRPAERGPAPCAPAQPSVMRPTPPGSGPQVERADHPSCRAPRPAGPVSARGPALSPFERADHRPVRRDDRPRPRTIVLTARSARPASSARLNLSPRRAGRSRLTRRTVPGRSTG